MRFATSRQVPHDGMHFSVALTGSGCHTVSGYHHASVEKPVNRWQLTFIALGAVAIASLLLFPPKIVAPDTVRHLVVFAPYPIDMLRLFLWIVAVLLVTAAGAAINGSEHGRDIL